MPSRLVTDDDLNAFYKAMQVYEVSKVGTKQKAEKLGGLDTQQYGRGKRAREVGELCLILRAIASSLVENLSRYCMVFFLFL